MLDLFIVPCGFRHMLENWFHRPESVKEAINHWRIAMSCTVSPLFHAVVKFVAFHDVMSRKRQKARNGSSRPAAPRRNGVGVVDDVRLPAIPPGFDQQPCSAC